LRGIVIGQETRIFREGMCEDGWKGTNVRTRKMERKM
jgi:hypothetical protein